MFSENYSIGQEMWGIILFENEMANIFSTIHPKEMIMSKNSPSADDRIRLTVPSIMSVGAWLSEEENYLESIEFDYSIIPVANIGG